MHEPKKVHVPLGIKPRNPENPTLSADTPILPEIGLINGFTLDDHLSLSPTDPSVSTSPHHKTRGAGERRFIRDEHIFEDIGSIALSEVRSSVVNEFVESLGADREPVSPTFSEHSVLSGINKFISRFKGTANTQRVANLAEDALVVNYVAEKIDSNKSYLKPDDPLRPITFRQRRLARKLERLKEKTVQKQIKYMYIADSVGTDAHTDQYAERVMERKPTSGKESRYVKKTISRAVKPHKSVQKLIDKRKRIREKETERVAKIL